MNTRLISTITAVVIGIAVIYFVAVWAIPRVLVTLTKAAPATKVSVANSIVLGTKILAIPDGKDTCVVNVFLLDASNKGVIGKKVILNAPSDVAIKTANDTTDSDGKVTFLITSTKSGQYLVRATTGEGMILPRGVTLTFRD